METSESKCGEDMDIDPTTLQQIATTLAIVHTVVAAEFRALFSFIAVAATDGSPFDVAVAVSTPRDISAQRVIKAVTALTKNAPQTMPL